MFTDIVLLMVTIICVYTDLTQRKIYNTVLFTAVVLAFGYHAYAGGLAGVSFSLQGLFLGLAFLLIPYALGGIGAGDVKLLATIGALKGPGFVFTTFLAGAMAGGALSIFYLAKKKRLLSTLKNLFLPMLSNYGFFPYNAPAPGKKLDQSCTIPYGAAIAMGTIAAYLVR